jgi:hypothetical protein
VKRHPYLQPLSDDHHRALVLARRMRRIAEGTADPSTLAEAWREMTERFASELEPHFRIEERWLFPELEAAGERALCERALTDHARLRALVSGAPGPEAAGEFAQLVDGHVRFEERELFAAAERLLEARRCAEALRVAEGVREACIGAALAGYEDASIRGVCHEGAWETAVGAIRSAPLEDIVARVVETDPRSG